MAEKHSREVTNVLPGLASIFNPDYAINQHFTPHTGKDRPRRSEDICIRIHVLFPVPST